MASVVVRMADGTKKAAVNLPGNLTIGQLLQTTQQRWNLPSNTEYDARLDRTGVQLDPSATLDSVGVEENDVLVILPRLVGGKQ
jgi:hypothetical protein